MNYKQLYVAPLVKTRAAETTSDFISVVGLSVGEDFFKVVYGGGGGGSDKRRSSSGLMSITGGG